MAELAPLFVIFGAAASVVILAASLIRKSRVSTGFVALGWALLVWLLAALIARLVGGAGEQLIEWIVGGILTLLLLRRDGYRPDATSWVLLVLLGPAGWFLALWRRGNARERERVLTA